VTHDSDLAYWQARVDLRTFTVLWLIARLQGDAPFIQITQPELASKLKISPRSCNRLVVALHHLGAIEVARTQTACRYSVMSPTQVQWWDTPDPVDAPETAAPKRVDTPEPVAPKPVLFTAADSTDSNSQRGAPVLKPIPPDFEPGEKAVQDLLARKPELQPHLDELTLMFRNHCQANARYSADFNAYWVNYGL
jgi:hypothetical protein